MTTFDIVVYGATGFTGRQAAHTLATRAPASLRLAIAGRSASKLEELRKTLGREVGVIVADSGDVASIDAMVASARVIVSTAGPFSVYSEPVVAACVAHKVDYVDITGESVWVRSLIDRYQTQAAGDGTRIVPFCGFDSVPSDLTTWAAVDWIRRTWGEGTRSASASFKVRGGGWNGGTLASATLPVKGAGRIADPVLLSPPDRRAEADRRGQADRRSTTWDADRAVWLAPFFMAMINTRGVRRSAGLYAQMGAPYGRDFTYDEAFETKTRGAGLTLTAATAVGFAALGTSAGRKLVARFGTQPGQGPSEEAMDKGSVRVRVVATADSGRKAISTFTASGDAGNRVTVRILCECALALVLDRERLPKVGGILTPAVAFGPVLVDRLRELGTTVDVAAI